MQERAVLLLARTTILCEIQHILLLVDDEVARNLEWKANTEMRPHGD